jgi:hypothetical protein
MAAGLIGRKLGMTQIFREDGKILPVTVIEAGPCYVIQKKETEKDGYTAIQVGFEKKEKNVKKPEAGHFKNAAKGVFKKLKEFRVASNEIGSYELGSELTVTMFKPGEKIKSPVLQRAGVLRVLLKDGALAVEERPTVRNFTEKAVPSVRMSALEKFGKGRKCRVDTVMSRLL